MAAEEPQNLAQLVRANVRRLRRQQGMTQEKLAERAGVSRTYIGYLESRGENVTLTVLGKLAMGLDVDPRELLKPSGEWNGEPSGAGGS